jgi:two-component system, OmpR family, alkaline phosphatase synthesis response regulator PhoP
MRKPPLILLVDDETHIVNVLSVKLRSAGLCVTCVMDGHEAIRAALENPPDLIITDYMMPKMDGRTLCEALIRFKQTSNVPVIMLTGRSQGMGNSLCEECENIKAVLAKPFSPRGLLDKVNELLNISPGEEVSKAS